MLLSVLLLCGLMPGGCASNRVDPAVAEARHKLISDNMSQLVTGGKITHVRWSDDGSFVNFERLDQRFHFDLASRRFAGVDQNEQGDSRVDATQSQPQIRSKARSQSRPQPGRGRQRDREKSPDGKWTAVCKDWNVVLEPSDEGEPVAVTTDGNRKFRYGTASWVYGEELDQHDAMWWSPDSSKLVFYEFDERAVPDHYLTAGLTDLHTKVLTEGYPKPGEPNPIANLLIYDLNSKQTLRIGRGEGAESEDWYTYAVQFAPDGSQLLFNRTNRHQDDLRVVSAELETGKTRTILTETQATWQDNAPTMKFLADGHRFIWATEKTGWKQFELRDLDGSLINSLTRGEYPVASIEKIDEDHGVLYYTAFSDANPLNAQLHRVGLDGRGQARLTREPFNHSVQISPDSKWFITSYDSVDTPPTTALYDTNGNRITTLARSDRTRFEQLQLEKPELFKLKADDGKTDLYGVLYKPSHFHKLQKYPLVIDVYGGPLSQSVHNHFIGANPNCEYGFLIAAIDNRGTVNRGKAFESATYLKLGDVDIKDQADGVRFLERRSYVDSKRIGIYGHSYGGYMSALALLKYPDVFQAASAGGTVTDWRNYDTIYTERFMRTPQENPDGYDAGSCLTYAKQLKGNLLLLHGMVDDNVHPSNAWQLIDALQKSGKTFEMFFFPNSGHSLGAGANAARWQFLRKSLITDPQTP